MAKHRDISPSKCQSCRSIADFLGRCACDRPGERPTNAEICAAVKLVERVMQNHLAHLVLRGFVDAGPRTLLVKPPARPILDGPQGWAATVPGLHPTTTKALMVPARMGWTGQLSNVDWAEAAGLPLRTLEWHRRVLAGRTAKRPIPLIEFRRSYIEVGENDWVNDKTPYQLRQADGFTLLSGIEASPLEGDALGAVPELARAVLHGIRWFDYAMTSPAGIAISANNIAKHLTAGWPAHALAAILNSSADRRPQRPRAFLAAVLANEPRLKGGYVIPAQVQFEGMARKGECLLCHNPAWELPGRTPLCGGDRCQEEPASAPALALTA